jgi:hypothetical protein
LGCVGDADGDGLPAGDGLAADGVAPAGADTAGVPVGPAVGVGAADEAVTEGTVADADGDAAADGDVAVELGVGLGLAPPAEGRQMMIRMQL